MTVMIRSPAAPAGDWIEGGIGNDVIDAGDGANSIWGHDGDDQITSGSGSDWIEGGTGNDVIDAGDGANSIWGHDGDDQITSGSGSDWIEGGIGNDVIDAGDGANSIWGHEGDDQITSGSGRDRIEGGTGNDVIHAGAGDDRIEGNDGNDVITVTLGINLIWGGVGNDIISGGAGVDRIEGNDGDDTIDAGAGDDQIWGNTGNDTIIGGLGDDRIFAGAGVDYIEGNEGDDFIDAQAGIGNVLYGGDGNDTIYGADDGSDEDPAFPELLCGDIIVGGIGDDHLFGLGGADRIEGNEGQDFIDGGMHSDTISGGMGNDEIWAGVGGLADLLQGDEGNDFLYGSNVGDDTIFGNAGNDHIYGQGGNDTLYADSGDDYVDAGSGTDLVYGGDGDDELCGGGGVGDRLEGGDGDDVLRGSDDGADFLFGNAGRDVIFAFAGNDIISGGDGDDVIHGGPGDDTIAGDAGSDLLLGNGDHDTLYGHSASGTDDDGAVDYLYGDFGTDANEVGTGQDQLFGGFGNDVLFGEGDDDYIDQGAGNGDLIFFGAGESANPNDFVVPVTTPPPTVQSGAPLVVASASLPIGLDHAGRWAELAGSATDVGISGDPALSIEPTVAVYGTARYVAWVDARFGNYEIYVARHTDIDGWQQLDGSAEQGGITVSQDSSRRPVIAINSTGQPIVAWTEFTQAGSDIHVMAWDDALTQWTALGDSASSGGISLTGCADQARMIYTPDGPLVAWLDGSDGVTNVYAKRFTGSEWVDIAGSSVVGGVSASATDVESFALASYGNQVAVAWTQSTGTQSEIYLKEFSETAWNELAGSATGGGVSNTALNSVAPTVAYHQGQLYVAWQQDVSEYDVAQAIYAKQLCGGTWLDAGSGATSGYGVGNVRGYSTQPILAADNGEIYITWNENHEISQTGEGTHLYVRRWNGSSFIEDVTGDASADGVSLDTTDSSNVAMTVDSSGRPWVVWQENSSDSSEIFLQAQLVQNTSIVLIADSQTSVQDLLDQNTLGAGDQILVTESQTTGFTVTSADSGVLIYGAPDVIVNAPVIINGAANVIIQRIQIASDLTVANATGTQIRENTISGGSLVLNADTDTTIVENTILHGIHIDGGSTRPSIIHNHISEGIALIGSGAIDLLVEHNTVLSGGIELVAASSGNIRANQVTGATGLLISATFTGIIEENDIHDASVGVQYNASAALSSNRIFGNDVGVLASVADPATALGGHINTDPNDIFGNVVGVQLNGGRVLNQHIVDNVTGITGSGIVGGDDPAIANWIARNDVGVDITGDVQFNRLSENTTAIHASSGALIAHNILDMNIEVGVQVNSIFGVRIVNNTIVAEAGANICLMNSASEIEIRNNILSTSTGVCIDVADNSQAGFFSDYNSLYAGAGGILVHWLVDFTDILDWQEDVHKYDLNSIGSTVINPNWSKPRFLSVATGDYRVFDIAAGQRFSSPQVDAADPVAHLAADWPFANLLSNPNFALGLSNWTVNPGATTGTPTSSSFDGSPYFVPGDVEVSNATQTIDLIAAGFSAAELDAQNLVAVFGGRIRAANESATDQGQIQIVFLDGASVEIADDVVEASNTTQRWELIGGRAALPVGTRQIRFEFTATRKSGTSNDSYLDDARLYLQPETFAPDQGAYGNAADDVTTTAVLHIALRTPDLYVDWERDLPHTIRWDTYANDANLPVQIDLYQDGPDGPAWLRNIAAVTSDDGHFIWTPANDDIDYGTHGLRVQVSLVGHTIVLDRGEEAFSVPENTVTFFANDQSTTDDEYTSAIGDNRNTGKTADAPKPNPSNLLRIYTLGPTHTLYLDTGDYYALAPIVLSGRGDVGDDEGFVFTGPTDPARVASIHHAHPATVAPVIELIDADYTTLSRLDLSNEQYGILARSSSVNLVADHLRLVGNSLDGIRIEDGSTATSLEHLQVENNGRYGIYVDGAVDLISHCMVQSNGDDGIYVNSTTPTVIQGSTVSNNAGRGIYLYHYGTGTAVIGNADLSLELGNRVWNNGDDGIDANSHVLVVGNMVYGHDDGPYDAGIKVSNGAEARQNVVYENYYGISASDGIVNENRVYNNETGIILYRDTTARGNQVYSNSVGIRGGDSYYYNWFRGPIENNLVYANANQGIVLQNAKSGTEIINNTVYQEVGDAVLVENGSEGVLLRNNILWVDSGYAINVDANSQQGFDSDYNLVYATGTGAIGRWQAIGRSQLGDWRNAAFTDVNSLSQDPLFIDRDGADEVLGYFDSTNDGRDDDFHLMSRYGRFTGSFAPVLDAGSGLPMLLPSSESTDAHQSSAIDRGDALYPFADELSPNGNFVNLGAYGNTTQASKSPSEYVLVTSPDGNEVWPAEQTFTIKWRSELFSPTTYVNIELMRDGDSEFSYKIAVDAENDGQFQWTIPNDQLLIPTATDYRIGITRTDNGLLTDVSGFAFSITEPITVYYVNLSDDIDFSDNEYTSVAGSDANDGLSGITPMASIRSVLTAYDVGAGDVILVDTGVYTLSTNIVVTSDDSGVMIQGPIGEGHEAMLDRGNTATGSYVFELVDADGITLDHLGITGAYTGVYAGDSSDSDDVTIQNSEIVGNYYYGLRLEASNDRSAILGNTVHDQTYSSSTGIYLYGVSDATVSGNTVYANGTGIDAYGSQLTDPIAVSGNTVFDNSGTGIVASGNVLVMGNTVYGHDGSDDTGIKVSNGAEARQNVVYENYYGISASDGIVNENRVYNNETGIILYRDTTARGNQVYSNSVGIRGGDSYYYNWFRGPIENNLVYANTNQGIVLQNSKSGTEVINNTVYQEVGDAVLVENGSEGVLLRNNILWVDSGYAINVDADSLQGFDSDYNLLQTTGTGKLGNWAGFEFTSLVDWFYELGQDAHSRTDDPQFVDFDGADDILGFDTTNDHGTDDDFHLENTSPAIDAGDPRSFFLAEPSPSGSRVNLGRYGNTSEATASPAQLVQVLSPNGHEKFEVGQEVTIAWQSAGLTLEALVALSNAGNGGTVGEWHANPFLAERYTYSSFSNAVDLSAVSHPAPESVYQTYDQAGNSVGDRLAYELPVADGTYDVRLHFAEPWINTVGDRVFDIFLNGSLVQDDFDIAAVAGGSLKATTITLTGTATGGNGLLLELVNETAWPAILSAIEITAACPSGVADPTVDMLWSDDSGNSFTTIATGLAMDRFGRGNITWTAPSQTDQGLIRVVANDGSMPSDDSDQTFQIANAGTTYYVNLADDTDFSDNEYTSAAGNNANTGKSADAPMASLAALLAAYDLGAGDVILVDTGVYTLSTNIVVTSDDSGVMIQGPIGEGP